MDALCFEKMDEHPVHTIPNHYPTKMYVYFGSNHPCC